MSDTSNDKSQPVESETHIESNTDEAPSEVEPENGSSAADPGDRTRPLDRLVGLALGADLAVRFGPELLEFLAAYVSLLRVLPNPGTAESIVIFGFALGYSDVAWGVGWAVLAVLAVVYVPSLVRPGRSDWPDDLPYRATFACPVLGAGLLAEAAFRRLLEQIVTLPPAPVALPVSVPAFAGVLVTTIVLFAWLGMTTDDGWPTSEYRFASFLVRGVLLVAIVGIFFAEFSLLSPYSEVLAFVLYLAASGPDIPGDPTERLTQGVATVWGRPAQVVMVLYVTGVISTVVFVVSTVRFSVPARIFETPFSMATVFLLVVAGSALFHTYMYGERMLRRFREQLEGNRNPARRVGGFLGPSAILTSLLLDGYVFSDPTVPPGIAKIVVGLWVALAAVMMVYIPVARLSTPREEDDDVTVTAGGIDLTKSLSESGDTTQVTFSFESSRSDPVSVRLTENLPNGLTPKDIFAHGGADGGGWEIKRRELVYEATIEPVETHEFQYRLQLQENPLVEDLWNGFRLDAGLDNEPPVEDFTTKTGTGDDFPLKDYHLVPVAAGLFVALLGAVRPLEGQYLVPMLLDGRVFDVDVVSVGSRFGLLFGLVVLPYVPVGVATHIRYRRDLHERRDAELTASEETFAVQLTGMAVASSLILCALIVLVTEVPVLNPTWETVTFYSFLLVAARVAVWMGSFADAVGQTWLAVRTVLKTFVYVLVDLLFPLFLFMILVFEPHE